MAPQKKALVINPWVTDFKLYDEWMHPLGLYALISLLKHNGWDLHYINCLDREPSLKIHPYNTGDFSACEIPKPQIYGAIHRKYKRYGIDAGLFISKLNTVTKPDIICIGTGMTYWFDGVIMTVGAVRQVFPGVPIILGGIAATIMPDIIKRVLPDVAVFSGSLFNNYTSLMTLHPLFANLSNGRWRCSFTDAFAIVKPRFHGPVLSSLGCPLRCSYCASATLYDHFSYRPLETIMNEIRSLVYAFSITDFALFDDAFLYKAGENFFPLTGAIDALGASINLHCPNGLHVRYITDRVAESMIRSGFKTIRLGYETGNRRYQKETASKTTVHELKKTIALLHKHGTSSLDIGIYLMAGLPGQTPGQVLEEIRSIGSLNVKVKPVFLSPVPHTRVFTCYASVFPELTTDYHTHNDLFFITKLPGWDAGAVQEIRDAAKRYRTLCR
jgi:hypothetical protein